MNELGETYFHQLPLSQRLAMAREELVFPGCRGFFPLCHALTCLCESEPIGQGEREVVKGHESAHFLAFPRQGGSKCLVRRLGLVFIDFCGLRQGLQIEGLRVTVL